MPQDPGLIPEVTINGTFGQLFRDNVWLVNVQEVQAKLTVDKTEIRMAGKRGYGYKMMGTKGDGTITQFKVTSAFLALIAGPFQGSRVPLTVVTLNVKLDDVEALGAEWLTLDRVKFWEINFGYKVNEIVSESIPFTFEGLEIIKAISGDPTQVPVGRV